MRKAVKHILIILLIGISYAAIYRIRGGYIDIPRPIPQIAFVSLIAYFMYGYGAKWYYQVLSFVIGFLAVSTGHGQYLPMGQWVSCQEPETLDFIVSMVYGADNCKDFTRDFIGMYVTGLGIFIIPGLISILRKDWIMAIMLFTATLAKPLSYTFGHFVRMPFPKGLDGKTEVAEIMFGILYGIIFYQCISIVNKQKNML